MGFIRNGSYYTLVDGPTWNSAEANSVNLGGNLATINSRDENDTIQAYLASINERAWIGLSDRETEGEWVWSSGAAITFTNWHAGQPDNSTASDRVNGQDYAYTGPLGTWDDGEDPYWPGIDTLRGIAEIPLSYFSVSDLTVTEGEKGSVTISRTGGTLSSQTITLATSNGTAEAGSDYKRKNKTITFAPGQTSKTVKLVTKDDTLAESNETFNLTLSASGADAVPAQIADGTGIVTIVDNDSAEGDNNANIVGDFNQVQQAIINNSGGQINNSTVIAGSNVTIINDNSFNLIDNSVDYTINVLGSLAIGNKNSVGNQKNVSFRITGTNAGEAIKGTLGQVVNEFLDGGAGDDDLQGFEGADVLAGGEGNDFLHGNYGGDLVNGGVGDDTMRGGHGHDEIIGGDGGDWIWGGIGRNTIDAGASDNARDDVFVPVDSIQNQFGNPDGANADVLNSLGVEDKIFLHGSEGLDLSYGLTQVDGQQGVGIYANGGLEALVTGGLSVEQVQGMTTGGFFA